MSISDFISVYNPNVQEVFIKLRAIVLELLPESEEVLYEGWSNVSYRVGLNGQYNDFIIYLAPFKDSVNLGFFRGTSLKDENQLLKGTGKKMRHIKFKSMDDYPTEDIKKLILEAQINFLQEN